MTLTGAIAVTRFGLGSRPGEIDEVSRDPHAWLQAQVRPGAVPSFPDRNLSDSTSHLIAFQGYRQSQRAMRNGDPNEFDQQAYRRRVRQTLIGETTARIQYGAETPNGFHERLVRFWANHFTVSSRRAATALLAGAYEREAIRPHILGRFSDLARSAVFHPAMLIYLDNFQSIGPGSRAGRRSGRGLNENLAREVMELHTVTPSAGYSQTDVTEFARALTGWTIGSQRLGSEQQGETRFDDRLHEPGARTVLGRRYRENGGDQAISILDDLCTRPETATSIAEKLTRHLLADDPPPDLVTKIASVFRTSNGDLPAVYSALIEDERLWAPAPLKVKTPDELITSTARLMGVTRVLAGDPRGVFESLAQRPFNAPSPQGWPDTAEDWIGPDSLNKRIEWANRLASRTPDLDARQLITTALGPRAQAETLQAISRAESGQQALALALMSPDFQRR